MNDTDEKIIRLYEARDEQAIAESERQYGRYCTSISENILNNKQDAEACVNDTWLYYPEYDVFGIADSAGFQENVYTRLTSPCISREGPVIITNDMLRDTELKALSVIDIGTGKTVLTGNDEPGGFPQTLAPGQPLTLTSLGTLPKGICRYFM